MFTVRILQSDQARKEEGKLNRSLPFLLPNNSARGEIDRRSTERKIHIPGIAGR